MDHERAVDDDDSPWGGLEAVFSGLSGLAAAAASSAPWLAHITELTVLEDLGEALLDCADGAAWLAVVAEKAQGQ